MTGAAGDRFTWVEVVSAVDLWAWLAEHHGQDEAVWLVTYKKVVPDRYVPHGQVLDALVAFGWCDGGMRRIDDDRVRQLVSPRRTQPWAKSYKDRAERLTAEGAMAPSGIESVVRAKATGMWEAMNDVDALVVPADLELSLGAHPPADAHFAAFPASTRRNILRWIENARTPATRSKRIALTVADAQNNVRVRSNG